MVVATTTPNNATDETADTQADGYNICHLLDELHDVPGGGLAPSAHHHVVAVQLHHGCKYK